MPSRLGSDRAPPAAPPLVERRAGEDAQEGIAARVLGGRAGVHVAVQGERGIQRAAGLLGAGERALDLEVGDGELRIGAPSFLERGVERERWGAVGRLGEERGRARRRTGDAREQEQEHGPSEPDRDASSHASSPRGKVTTTAVPRPTLESMTMSASCTSAIHLAMDSPRPAPAARPCEASPR